MAKNLIIFLLGILTLIVGVLWYLADRGYEPLALIITSLIALLSKSGLFSDGVDDLSKTILKIINTNKEHINNKEVSNDVVTSSKSFDSLLYYIKRTASYITSFLFIITFMYIAMFIADVKDIPNSQIITQLEENRPLDMQTTNKESEFDVKSLYFLDKVWRNEYTPAFLLVSFITFFVQVVFIDIANRSMYNLLLKKLGTIKESKEFMDECHNINAEFIHYDFKNPHIPDMLKLAIAQVFSNIHLHNIK